MYRAWLKPNWKQAVELGSYDFDFTSIIEKVNAESRERINNLIEKFKNLPIESKYAMVEISGGNVIDYETSEDVELILIDHDNLEMELPQIIDVLGYDGDSYAYAEVIFDEVIEAMREEMSDDVPRIVANIMNKNK